MGVGNFVTLSFEYGSGSPHGLLTVGMDGPRLRRMASAISLSFVTTIALS